MSRSVDIRSSRPPLTQIGVFYLLAKLVAIAVNAVVNFTAFRFWVFR